MDEIKKVIIISGYFNPLHVGHLDYIATAKSLGDELCVIVNTDEQVRLKGSVPFQNESDRLRIVRYLKPVDYAVLAVDEDKTVAKTLHHVVNAIRLDAEENVKIIFANGGDITRGNTPEEVFCNKAEVETVYGVGGRKVQSSSELLSKAGIKK